MTTTNTCKSNCGCGRRKLSVCARTLRNVASFSYRWRMERCGSSATKFAESRRGDFGASSSEVAQSKTGRISLYLQYTPRANVCRKLSKATTVETTAQNSYKFCKFCKFWLKRSTRHARRSRLEQIKRHWANDVKASNTSFTDSQITCSGICKTIGSPECRSMILPHIQTCYQSRRETTEETLLPGNQCESSLLIFCILASIFVLCHSSMICGVVLPYFSMTHTQCCQYFVLLLFCLNKPSLCIVSTYEKWFS